jgi:hypothetical protein
MSCNHTSDHALLVIAPISSNRLLDLAAKWCARRGRLHYKWKPALVVEQFVLLQNLAGRSDW